MIMLRARKLTKTFILHLQGGVGIPVLTDACVELQAGCCLALIGASGAGKSTLMRSLYGSYLVDQGIIEVWHRGAWTNIATADARQILQIRRETLGYVSQFLRVVPRVPAIEIVAEAARAGGASAEEALSASQQILLRLNIPLRLHSLPPATFSGGEQQRVNLARGFIGRHPILLLDEPTASLDHVNRQVVIEMIQEAKHRGVALAGIFHDREVRDAVCDSTMLVSPVRQAA